MRRRMRLERACARSRRQGGKKGGDGLQCVLRLLSLLPGRHRHCCWAGRQRRGGCTSKRSGASGQCPSEHEDEPQEASRVTQRQSGPSALQLLGCVALLPPSSSPSHYAWACKAAFAFRFPTGCFFPLRVPGPPACKRVLACPEHTALAGGAQALCHAHRGTISPRSFISTRTSRAHSPSPLLLDERQCIIAHPSHRACIVFPPFLILFSFSPGRGRTP